MKQNLNQKGLGLIHLTAIELICLKVGPRLIYWSLSIFNCCTLDYCVVNLLFIYLLFYFFLLFIYSRLSEFQIGLFQTLGNPNRSSWLFFTFFVKIMKKPNFKFQRPHCTNVQYNIILYCNLIRRVYNFLSEIHCFIITIADPLQVRPHKLWLL